MAAALEIARVLRNREFEKTLVVACWDEEELGLIGSKAYAQREAEAGTTIQVSFVLEMVGYKDSAPNSQSLPLGFDTVFPDAAAEVASRNYRGDFLAVITNASAGSAAARIKEHGTASELPVIVVELSLAQTASPLLNDLRRSDHDAFWQEGYPAIMLTDTSEFRNDAYHCEEGSDDVSRLDHDFTNTIIKATVGAAAQELGLP